MLRLFEFLYRYRVFGLFLLLQGISFWLVFSYNNRYNTYFLNSSNNLAGRINEQVNGIYSYFELRKENKQLSEENLMLRNILAIRIRNSIGHQESNDSAKYHLMLAEIINSTHLRTKNHLTLRINSNDSIRPGMGVVSPNGVIGRVKSVSRHFATVTSLLNPQFMVSGRVKSNNAICTIQWDGITALEAELKYVPRHLKLTEGDSVITSGFNDVFPEGFLVGIVSEVELRKESPFYDARIQLATDFTNVNTAYIVRINYRKEKIDLEKEVLNDW